MKKYIQGISIIAFAFAMLFSVLPAKIQAAAPVCSVVSYTINGSQTYVTIPYGSTATLAWVTSGCTSATVNGVTYTDGRQNSYSVSTPVITSPQSYTLIVSGMSGDPIKTTVSVYSGAAPVVTKCAINSYTINGSASTVQVPSGSTATLSWNTSNCARINVAGVDYTGYSANSNSIQTAPITSNQSYTLTGYNTDGTTIVRTVSANPIVVIITPTCAINSFTANGVANSITVPVNTSVNLAWNTSNCTSVVVNGITYTGNSAWTGNAYTGNLTSPRTYSIVAYDANGSQKTGSVYVNVLSQTCLVSSFTVNGTNSVTVPYNTKVNLVWTTSGCDTVAVNGITYSGSQAIVGHIYTALLTLPVNNFTLTARNSTGSTDSKTVTANVLPDVIPQPNLCVINSYTANGTENFIQIPINTSVTLAWSTSNCTSLTINGVAYTGSQINSGVFNTPSLNGTYNYILTAQSGNQFATRTINVTTFGSSQNNNCQVLTFLPAVGTVNYGNSTTLNWTLSSGCQSYVTISGPNMTSAQIYNGYITTGPVNVYSTYTLTAYNITGGGVVTSTTNVNVNNNNNNQQCNISYFTANGTNSAQIAQGATATISWSTNGCNNITVSGPGIYSQTQYGSMQTSPLYSQSANYTLTAYDTFYNNPQTRTVYVTSNQNTQTNLAPVTTIATNITTTSARLNGLIPTNPNGGSVNAYFEYGTTSGLGNQTNSQSVASYTFTNYYDTISVSPSTTYYYRAVENSNGVILRGDVVTFTTPSIQANVPPVIINRIISNTGAGTGIGSGFVSLSIMNQSATINPGDSIYYTINYRNISNQDLSNAMLSVILPTGVTYRGSTQGMPTTNNTIVASLGTITRGSQGSINIQAVADLTLAPGSNLVSTATLSFVIANGAQDSAVAYYLNNVGGLNINNNNNLGGFAFGAGFFPSTLLGWIILIAIIILLVLLGRRLSDSNKNRQYQSNNYPPTDNHPH